MKAYVNNKLILTTILLAISVICNSQNKSKSVVTKNSISFKFETLSNDLDCKVKEILEETKGVKVVFTCIGAGLVIVETPDFSGSALKAWFDYQIKAKKEQIKFDLIETYTINDMNNINSANMN